LNTSMRRNLHRVNTVKDRQPPVFITSKPPLQWSEKLRLAMRLSVAANSCETAFHELHQVESNSWNLKKPPVIKFVQKVPVHHWLSDILHPATPLNSAATTNSKEEVSVPSESFFKAVSELLGNLASLQLLHEAHSLLRMKEDTPLQSSHVLINSFREDGERNHHHHGHSKDAKHHHHHKKKKKELVDEEVRQDLKPLQKSVIEALQNTNKSFMRSEARLSSESERSQRADKALKQAWSDFWEGSQKLERIQKKLGELQVALRRQLRSRDKHLHHHWDDQDSSTTETFSHSPSSLPQRLHSPDSHLNIDNHSSDGSHRDLSAELQDLQSESVLMLERQHCCEEMLFMSCEDSLICYVSEGRVLQELVGCLHKTNLLNDYWRAAFVEKNDEVPLSLHLYLYKQLPYHRGLDLAAFFAHYWHHHFHKDKEINKHKLAHQQQHPHTIANILEPQLQKI